MDAISELSAIYEKYEKKLEKVTAAASAFAGAFGLGDDPRKDACNQIFYDEVESWAEGYVSAPRDPETTARAVRLILDAPAASREKGTYWYTYAAQKHAAALIPMLEAEEAAAIRAAFRENYPRLDWTPVQQQIDKALTAACGEQETQTPSWLRKWGRRVIALLVGLTIAHLGVTLFLLADLGSDPFNVMIQGLHRSLAGDVITHGTVHVIVSLLIILVLLVVDRSYVRIGTFLCMILGGPIIDVFTLLLGGIIHAESAMAVRIIAVILGCGILAFGMTIVIKSQAGTGPNDLVAVVISDKRKWKFGIVRIAVDVAFAAAGFCLGGTVGIGTIICLAVVGPVAQIFMPFSEKICGRFLQE